MWPVVKVTDLSGWAWPTGCADLLHCKIVGQSALKFHPLPMTGLVPGIGWPNHPRKRPRALSEKASPDEQQIVGRIPIRC